MTGAYARAGRQKHEIEAVDVAQEECPERAVQPQQVVDLGLPEPVVAHRALGHAPDVKFYMPIRRRSARDRIAAPDACRADDIDVLATVEFELARRWQAQQHLDHVFRKALQRIDATGQGARMNQLHVAEVVDIEFDIGSSRSCAGEDPAGRELGVAQAGFVLENCRLANADPSPAGAATAGSTTVCKSNIGSQCCIEQRLALGNLELPAARNPHCRHRSAPSQTMEQTGTIIRGNQTLGSQPA